MNSTSIIHVPLDVLQRWHALVQLRNRGAAGRCNCSCRCSSRSARSEPVPTARA